jgi:hypothetical protein
LKSGSLNLLEPSGPVQACNGIALPYLSSDVIFQISNNSILAADVWGSIMIMNGEMKINVEKNSNDSAP